MTTAGAAGLAFVAGAGLAVLVPPAANGGVRRSALAAAGPLLLMAFGAAFAVGPARAMAAVAPLAGFALALAGAVRAGSHFGAGGALTAALVGVAGCAVLVAPFVGDVLVEPGGPGRSWPAAVEFLVGVSPAAASAGGALGVDFLRSPLAYGAGEGTGLSRIGPFFAFEYPAPWTAAGLWGGAGLVLFAATSCFGRRTDA